MKISVKNAGQLFPTVCTLATCADEEGNGNIITLGWAMKTSGDPPMVAISVKPSRHSHDLIKDGGEFVLSIPTEEVLSELHYCGRNSGRDVNKFEETGLTPVTGERVNAPLIGECAANLECKLVSELTTGDHTIFVGEVVAAHVDGELFDSEKSCLDLDLASAIVTHSDEYRTVGEVVAYKLNGDIDYPE
ncbi:MAG: flavin reductase family protein [Candidatus Bathyarchaeia archaeon]